MKKSQAYKKYANIKKTPLDRINFVKWGDTSKFCYD